MTDYGNFEELVREIYPVTGLVAYGSGNYEVRREAKVKSRQPKPKRGQIRMASKNSLKRLMFLMQITRVSFGSMFTATYPKVYPNNGSIVHDDINALASKFRRASIKYVWFLEFQTRGAPHIHWLLNTTNMSPKLRVDFGLYWTNRIVQSEWFNVEFAGDEGFNSEVLKIARFNIHPKVWETLREQDAAKKYVAKYASKQIQKVVPKQFSDVGRFWGSTRDIKPQGIEIDASEEEVEQWLVKNRHPMAEKTLVPRYIWQVGELINE